MIVGAGKRGMSLTISLLTALGMVILFAGGANPAMAQEQEGVVCLFLAPSGANNFGHIGWAFSQGGGNNWVFGATEGVAGQLDIPKGQDNHSWRLEGTFAAALDVFRSGQQYGKGPGYYQSYSCKPVSPAHPDVALSKAESDATTYSLPRNNCLTKAVNILRAYGVSHLGPPVYKPPNEYYATLIRGDPPNWSQSHSL